MQTHVIQLERYCAQAEGVRGRLVLGTWNSYGIEQLQLVLGDGWEGRTVTAVFHGPKTSAGTTVLAGSDGLVPVPPEATADAGYGTITIVGVDADSQRISVDVPYVVQSHAPVDGAQPDPTPDQWQQYVAQVKQYADRAEQEAGDAADSAAAAAKSAEAAADSAQKAEQAGADIGEAKDAALEAIQQAQDTGVQAVQAATTTGVQAVQQVHQAALDDIATERETALEAVQTEGDKQQSAIAGSGTAALEAIGQVEQTAIGQVQQAGAAQVDSVNAAGNAQLDKINAANAILPTPTEADAGKAPIAQPDGTYALGEVSADAYTKEESDARYAPIAAAIKVSGKGTGRASLSPTVGWAMQGLSVYGKSTQDGVPSPENPVPIVSAGESGSIAVTVSDGADQSQQLAISTPNGLPGIPVDSGGNWTDENGQQLVSDVVYLAAGTKTQSLARYSASELTFRKDFYNLPDGTLVHRFSTTSNPLWKDRAKALCNIFSWVYSGSQVMVNFQTEESKIRLFFDDSYETQEQVSQFLADKNAEFLVQLATPITTPLTAEEIATYRALQSYPDTTNVLATNAGIEASAVAEPTQYIEDRIQAAVTQAVTQAVTLTGGNT